MSYIEVNGKRKLDGSITLQGSKNSSLPILAATVLCKGESIIHNCPDISDVSASIEILRELGCVVSQEKNTVVINSAPADNFDIDCDLMKKMRSSIVFLGAVVSRFKKAKLCFPGGCELGPRPIDIHISALKKLGVEISEKHGFIDCEIKEPLRGGCVILPFPSVGATENIILATAVSNGVTVIKNAAREPEISDLCDFLNKCGAKISGAGESEITVEGAKKLHGAEHRVIPDRIVAATYLSAAALSGGRVSLKNAEAEHLSAVLPVFTECGCNLSFGINEINISSAGRLGNVRNIRTMPYPGFPTDAQPIMMAMLSLSRGSTMFIETIFQGRYKYVSELLKFGADIKVEGNVAVLSGVERLYGAAVDCTDLRGGAAMVLSALAADGQSKISDIEHIQRGYESFSQNLALIGADINTV